MRCKFCNLAIDEDEGHWEDEDEDAFCSEKCLDKSEDNKLGRPEMKLRTFPLWSHLHDEHGLILLESELIEIERIVHSLPTIPRG
jgi:hypothetical protein